MRYKTYLEFLSTWSKNTKKKSSNIMGNLKVSYCMICVCVCTEDNPPALTL